VNESYTLRVNGDTHEVHDAWIGEILRDEWEATQETTP